VSALWVQLDDAGRSSHTGVALRAVGAALEPAAVLTMPRGGDPLALRQALREIASPSGPLDPDPRLVLTGGAERLEGAARLLSRSLGMPLRLVEIGASAGRLIDAWPDGRSSAIEEPAAALAPRDAAERRRRGDAALAAGPLRDRAEIADRLGDLAESPERGRDGLGSALRVAAIGDALRRLVDLPSVASRAVGTPVIVVGAAAAAVLDGALPIEALAPVCAPGTAHMLFEPTGTIAALGDPSVEDGDPAEADDLARAVARALLLPAERGSRQPAARSVAGSVRLLPAVPPPDRFILGRSLIGDAVAGRVVAFDAEPDSQGWEAARTAGILAVFAASPETVLRARAVGVRGIIVRSLSDGEREALAASLERRIAAAVATEPFGLLVLDGRRPAPQGIDLRLLDGIDVVLSGEPAGVAFPAGRLPTGASDAPGDADVAIVGGPHEGRLGAWLGLDVTSGTHPLARVRLGAEEHQIPLGDLRRLVA